MTTFAPTSAAPAEGPEPWQLRFDDHDTDEFPDGLRMSEDCLCAVLRRPRVPEEYMEVAEAIEARGHGFEHVLAWNLRAEGHTVLREVTIPWEHGESHLDLMIVDGPMVDAAGGRILVREVKANKDGKCQPENVRQVQRQIHVTERAVQAGKRVRYKHHLGTFTKGKEDWEWRDVPFDQERLLEADWRIWVVEPYRWRVTGAAGGKDGIVVTLSDEVRADLDARLETIDSYLEQGIETLDPFERSHWPECTCSKCWKPPVSELPKDLYDSCYAYLMAREAEADAAAEKALNAADIKEKLKLRRQYLGLPEKVGPPVPDPMCAKCRGEKVRSHMQGCTFKHPTDPDGRRWEGLDVYALETRSGSLRVERVNKEKAKPGLGL